MTEPLQSRVVVAGAGTGKTHALVLRYLEALLGLDEGDAGPRTPDRILAITFTDKAASEMRARVQRRLAALLFAVRTRDHGGLDEVERALLERAEQRAEPHLGAGRPALTVSMLEALRRSISTAPILTFHAFCARILREHAIAAGLDPGFALLEPDEEDRLLVETAEAAVLDALPDPVVAELCARISLRGFGEHKGLVECLVDVHQTLAEHGLSARTLALAASPERADAEVEAALRAVSGCLGALQASTAKAAERVGAASEALAGLGAAWSERGLREDEDDREARIARAFPELRTAVGGNWGAKSQADARRAVVAAVDSLGAKLVDAFTVALAPSVRALVGELSVRAAREKDARGVLGFGDLLVRARDLLLGSRSVRTRVKSRFDRVLVDEYQDTSPAQEDILALVLEAPGEHTEVPADARPLDMVTAAAGRAFLVGDAKQSIYGFRGADPTVLLRALARVGRREELSVSRRSRAPVVELANLVAEHALPRGPLGTDRAAIVALSSIRGGEGAAGEHWLVDATSAEPDVRRWPAPEQEAAVVAARLRVMFDAGELMPRDVCVLVRRGSAAAPVARALGAAGISAVVVGGDGFYRRPEVSDVLSALALALDPTDELALLTVLRSPLVALPDDQVLALYQALPGPKRGLTWTRALSTLEDPLITPEVRARMRAFDEVLGEARRRIHQEPLARAVDVLLEEGAYAAACAVELDGKERLANLEKLRALCAAKDESALVALTRLVEALDDPPNEPLATLDDDGDPRGPVRIMTIHQAKGLEFPAVVLADASAGLRRESGDVLFDVDLGLAVTARGRPIAACSPDKDRSDGTEPALSAIQRVRRRLGDRGEAELARLLYVAVTRARDRVFVVGTAGHQLSLLKLLGVVRDAAGEPFNRLLPQVAVTPARPPPAPPAATSANAPEGSSVLLDQIALAMVPPALPHTRRIHASALGVPHVGEATEVRAPAAAAGAWDAAAAGRLAHGLLALVGAEHAELLDEEHRPALAERLARAARALGFAQAPPELLRQCEDTLIGPIRSLLDGGYELSFEEPLRLQGSDVVVEGRADLIARSAARTLVVDFKLSSAATRREATRAQLRCYAAALLAMGEPGVALAAWPLGERHPAAPIDFDEGERRALEEALARVRG